MMSATLHVPVAQSAHIGDVGAKLTAAAIGAMTS